jgi:hypothetical protein
MEPDFSMQVFKKQVSEGGAQSPHTILPCRATILTDIP